MKLLGAVPSATTDAVPKSYVDAIPGIKAVTTLTGTATATANTFHLVNLTSGLGAQTITLPAAPAQGTMCEFIRQDSNSATSQLSIVPGGTDTFLGTNPFSIAGSQVGAKFIYVGTVWIIHEFSVGGQASGFYAQRSAYVAGFNPSLMSRDANGRAQVNDPAVAADISTKNYVDGTIRAVSANTTANNRDIILADASSGNITITLPITAGAQVTVKKIDSSTNNVIVVGTSGTVDGDANATLVGQEASAVFVGDGTNLQIESINGVVQATATAWSSYTPVLSRADTGATEASSAASGKYSISGKTIVVQGTLASTNATAGSASVTLPFTAKDRILNCGTMAVTGATVPADQSGIAYMLPDQARLVVVAYSNGFRDVAAGAVLRWNVTYELP